MRHSLHHRSKWRIYALLHSDDRLSLTCELEILRRDLANMVLRSVKDHPNVTYLFSTTIRSVVVKYDKALKKGNLAWTGFDL